MNLVSATGGGGSTAMKEQFKMTYNILVGAPTTDNVESNRFSSQSGTPSSSYTIINNGTCNLEFIHNGVGNTYNCKVYHNSTLIFDSTVTGGVFKVYRDTFTVSSGDTISYTCTKDSSHGGIIDILIV